MIAKLTSHLLLLGLLASACLVQADEARSPAWQEHGRVRVEADGHYLEHQDGTPFFWLGDTGWQLFKELSREHAEEYLENRRRKGFNVIQAVLLHEYHDGNRGESTNDIAGLGKNVYGHEPLRHTEGKPDPARPFVVDGGRSGNPNDYWDHVEFVLDAAAREGLYVALLPVWGRNYIAGAQGRRSRLKIFNRDNARSYGRFVGGRFRDHANVIWVLGGDMAAVYPEDDYRPVFRAMAEGIARGVTGRNAKWNEPDEAWDQLLVTYHGRWQDESATWDWFGDDDVWLDIHDAYSGHGADKSLAYRKVQKAYRLPIPKPVINLEPPYEDHPKSFNPRKFGFFRDWGVRQAAYWSVFAGAAGHTYGHHAMWQFRDAKDAEISYVDRYWKDGPAPAKGRPGATQMGFLRQLMESRSLGDRTPDQSIIASPQPSDSDQQLRAIRGRDWAYVYTPHGTTFDVKLGEIQGEKVAAEWFNVRDGTPTRIGIFSNTGARTFDPPGKPGPENDWVLVLYRR